jgi:hypothetical protein
MLAVDNPIIRQFLGGKTEGPIGMDEMADEEEADVRGSSELTEKLRTTSAVTPA